MGRYTIVLFQATPECGLGTKPRACVWIVSEELLRVGWEEDYGVAKMRIKYSSRRGDRLAASKGYGD